MLHCDIFAGQLLLSLGVNEPPHLQHCGYCFVFCGVGSNASFVLFCVLISVLLLCSNWSCFLSIFLFDFVVHVLLPVRS